MKKEYILTEEMLNEYRRVAFYYYKADLTQEEIAKRMKMTRQRINRILKSCVEMGIVKITIEGLEKQYLELEAGIERKYGLRDVRVVDNTGEDGLLRELGVNAGAYLETIMKDGDIIGVTRGRTTAAMVDYWEPKTTGFKDLTITQLIGGGREVDSSRSVDRLVYRLAEKLGAQESALHAPVIVSDRGLKEMFTDDLVYRTAYDVIRNCTIAVVGIGTAHSQWKHMVALYDVNDAEQTKWAENVAGEICTHFFDADGNTVIPPFMDRIISITLEDFRRIPVRVGVAGGKEKTEAIRAAIKGDFVNVLITDVFTAQSLME